MTEKENPPGLDRQCSRWPSCSVNNCPLEDCYPNLLAGPNDKEPVCTMAKANRMRIASTEPGRLTMSGMKVREWAGFKRFAALPRAVRNQMAERGRERLKEFRKDKTNKTK